TRTSPVSRGKWILENILGTPAPVPPPGTDTNLEKDPVAVKATSLRQRLEAHRSTAVCASCHRIMDPIGFALENCDLIGAWREVAAMFIAKLHLSRRTFLHGLGAAVALPFLESMLPAATPLAQTAATPRTRLGCIYFPHGATMDKWTPASEGAGFELSDILQPLQPLHG